ncbi:TRAP transporter substrate-binding protein [Propylenella binzhouense]|uniref:TRAP transporter substrate-binding protein n=1 Tax=Propylenella binzhouense TaxID=2555902 RepID=A0A964T3G6_9HYPH|nr:TRAP transporter substrate-binding protein [Propylenella binzhouense]MYZ47768.1 TRAP transporter substrate-binding protein [Propylenella binzhouense]
MNALTRRNLLSGGAVAAASLATPALAQGKTEWRMVTSWPKNLPGPGMTAERLAQRIGAMSGGRLTVRLYAAGEIVSGLEVLDAVRGGAADAGHTASFYWQGKHPATVFFTTFPFGLTPTEHMAWIEHGGGQALWDELYARFEVKPFMAGNPGFNMGGWFVRPIRSLDDIRGLRLRVAGTGGEIYRRLGATPLTTPVSEILPALQSGMIDGAEFLGPQSDLASGFYKVARYYHHPGFNKPNGTGELIVSAKAWNALPDDLKAVVENAARAENAYSLAEAELMNARALAALKEKDIELVRFPADVVRAAQGAAAAILDEIAATDAIAGRIVASYRAARATLAPWSEVSVRSFLEARDPD